MVNLPQKLKQRLVIKPLLRQPEQMHMDVSPVMMQALPKVAGLLSLPKR